MWTLNSEFEVHPLQPMHDTDHYEGKIVDDCGVQVRSNVLRDYRKEHDALTARM